MNKFSLAKRFFSQYRTLSKEALGKHGLNCRNVMRNLSPAELYEVGVGRIPANSDTKPTVVSSTGAFCAYSSDKTGRTPQCKRMVSDDLTKDDIWWGKVNMPITTEQFKRLKTRALDYLSNKDRVYVVDGYVGEDPEYRLKVRIFCTRAYHALFMHNMMIRPTAEQLENEFDEVDFTVYNAGEFYADPDVMGSRTTSSFNIADKCAVILGSQYAGEMKKGLFTLMNYLMPKRGAVSLHASANEGKENKDTTVLFGLSGTGKTTLSADPKRSLIGDDEHVWTDKGIFNIEGGCYAKCIDLTPENEPEIFNAIKFGAVLENICFKEGTREVDYFNTSITQNTRVSYPLDFIPGAKSPAIGGHPKNIIFLTCDAFGVLPPVTKLSAEQAMYHFISGYTAKVAGTEMGITDPVPAFSACFGAAFLPLHPAVYAELLAEKIRDHGTDVWLINTGWVAGKYGVGRRISLPHTRAIIDAIHDGSLAKEKYTKFPVFNLGLPTKVNGVPTEILNPREAWTDKAEYDASLNKLGGLFKKNFDNYKEQSSEAILNAGPTL